MPEIRMRIASVPEDRSELCCCVSEERVLIKSVQISLYKAQWPVKKRAHVYYNECNCDTSTSM